MEHDCDVVRLAGVRHADNAEREIGCLQCRLGNDLPAGGALAKRCEAPAAGSLALDRFLLEFPGLSRVPAVWADIEHLTLVVLADTERTCEFRTKQSHIFTYTFPLKPCCHRRVNFSLRVGAVSNKKNFILLSSFPE